MLSPRSFRFLSPALAVASLYFESAAAAFATTRSPLLRLRAGGVFGSSAAATTTTRTTTARRTTSLPPTFAFQPFGRTAPPSYSSSSTSRMASTSTDDHAVSSKATTTASRNQCRVSSRVTQTLDPCVVLMKQLITQHASKWSTDPHGIYSLAQGVVHWRPPPSAYEAAAKAVMDDDVHRYCLDEGYPPLLEALGEKLERENGLREAHVMVTAGANQAFMNCVLTFLDERDEEGHTSKCVVFEPYYFNHVMAVQMSRGESNSSTGSTDSTDPSLEESGGSLLKGPTNMGVPDLQWLRSNLEKYQYGSGGGNAIRMVTLVNPGNPTGVSLPHSFLREITELTKEFGVWLIMDNTYEHFDIHGRNSIAIGDGEKTTTEDAPPEYPCFDEEHVVNIFSFSKGFAMAGFRVGYIALSSKGGPAGMGTQAYQQMLKVQDTIPICTSRISQMTALGALQAGREWVYEQVKTLETGRTAILEAMEPLERVIGGDGAMYVMGKLPEGTDDRSFADILVEKYGVAVIPGSFCGYPGWIRVCYSNLPPEDCKRAALRLASGIADLRNK